MLMQLFRRFPAIDSRCKVFFVFWLVHWVTCICRDWPERNRLDLGKHKGRFQFDEKSRFEFLKLLVTNGTTERQFSGISEKGTTYRGKSKLSEISYQECLFHWTSLPKFPKVSDEWVVRFSKLQQLQDFQETLSTILFVSVSIEIFRIFNWKEKRPWGR